MVSFQSFTLKMNIIQVSVCTYEHFLRVVPISAFGLPRGMNIYAFITSYQNDFPVSGLYFPLLFLSVNKKLIS